MRFSAALMPSSRYLGTGVAQGGRSEWRAARHANVGRATLGPNGVYADAKCPPPTRSAAIDAAAHADAHAIADIAAAAAIGTNGRANMTNTSHKCSFRCHAHWSQVCARLGGCPCPGDQGGPRARVELSLELPVRGVVTSARALRPSGIEVSVSQDAHTHRA